MNEGQYNQGNVTCFGKLKEYFNSKAMWDVNVDYSKVCDDFFSGYFRDAAEPMRAYFDELQAHLKYLEEAYPAEINGNIYNNIAQIRFWPKRTLDHWADYIEEAYSAIEKYKASDPALYETLKKHIKLESMNLEYQQMRQENITTELLDVVSGADVDKIHDGGVWADQGVIAGCSGGLFDNIAEAADIMRGGSSCGREFPV